MYNQKELEKNKEANLGRPYRQCSISVMDTIADPNITFDDQGICNYYHEFIAAKKKYVFQGELGNKKLKETLLKIRTAGKGQKYDCITGISGGVDSTYLTLKAKELGLNPLIVHFDNGWNSEIAVKNIHNIINKLGFDLYTLVVDWNEFRDIQLAYLKASVVDIETITDHAIIGTLYRLAAENGIKYILSGANIVTEHTLPRNWIWSKTDAANIKSIHKEYGRLQLKTYPFFEANKRLYYQNIKIIETVPLLDYMPYNKEKVKNEISEKLGWSDYGGKHFESVFTRFYQGYILPNKFNIDKRKAHLSTLIFDEQITKEQAIEELIAPIYSLAQLQTDFPFVLKKLGLSEDEFISIMELPRREHNEFDTDKKTVWDQYPFLKPLIPVWKAFKKLKQK